MRTGETKEGPLEDGISEFGMINPSIAGKPYEYTWAMTTKPGWFLFDGLMRLNVQSGDVQRYQWPEGVFASESPMAPRVGSRAEDDGYVITFVSNMNTNTSECQIFAADDITSGPICAIRLPQRICVGTHSYWADKERLA